MTSPPTNGERWSGVLKEEIGMALVEPVKRQPVQAAEAPSVSVVQPWEELAATPDFQRLLAAKKRFIVPATVFFVVYYFALPISVGYFPDFMSTRVIGSVNLAYLFALSQFIMAWGLAWLYVRQASNVFDRLAQAVLRRVRNGRT
jgi:uncharacterized membrane protein (DUF485 family)